MLASTAYILILVHCRDRLIDEVDRKWYDQKIIEVLENDFGRAWSAEVFVDLIWGDFLQGGGVGSYVEISDMRLADTKLCEYAEDYTLNLNKPMYTRSTDFEYEYSQSWPSLMPDKH